MPSLSLTPCWEVGRMQTPEEVAREWWESVGGGDVSNARDFADLVRARDAEVRAD